MRPVDKPGANGCVSLEVPPHLAYDTHATEALNDELQEDAVAKFVQPFEELLTGTAAQRAETGNGAPARPTR